MIKWWNNVCSNLGDDWTLPVMLRKNKPKGCVHPVEPQKFLWVYVTCQLETRATSLWSLNRAISVPIVTLSFEHVVYKHHLLLSILWWWTVKSTVSYYWVISVLYGDNIVNAISYYVYISLL